MRDRRVAAPVRPVGAEVLADSRISWAPGGRLAVQVLPYYTYERLLLNGFDLGSSRPVPPHSLQARLVARGSVDAEIGPPLQPVRDHLA